MQDAAGGFLERLGAADREVLREAGRERAFRPGEQLMAQGTRSDAVALLLVGAVRVAAATPDGSEMTLSLRGGGDLIGTLGALTVPPTPRAATVVAILPVRARLIATSTFLHLLEQRPSIAIALLSDVAEQWRESSRRHLQLGAYRVEQRLARLLVELWPTQRNGHADGTVEVPLSQTDLAGMIGASRDSAARVLGQFRQDGLVETGRRSIRILDVEGLRSRGHPEL